jgi:hypothetical protein
VNTPEEDRRILSDRAAAGRGQMKNNLAADYLASTGDLAGASEARAEASRLGALRAELDAKYTGPRPD